MARTKNGLLPRIITFLITPWPTSTWPTSSFAGEAVSGALDDCVNGNL